VANALLAIDPSGDEAAAYLERLESLKHTTPAGRLAWWEQPAQARTTFYGAGRGGQVETTALAALALMKGGAHAGTVRGALAWLVAQKDAAGTWPSTQATVLALKALLAGTARPLGGEGERRIAITWDGRDHGEVVIPPDQAEVVRQIDLSEILTPGTHRLTLTERGDAATGYQVAFRYHVPASGPEKDEPLAIDLAYDRTELAVGDTVTATATVTNRTGQAAPMVMLDLPIPPGFGLAGEDFAGLVKAAAVARYQVTPRQVLVYLRGLEPGQALTLRYRLRAVMPARVTVPAARVYEYYDPDRQGRTQPFQMTVK
jgi:hypothetical protein